jgi:ABC-type transporter Mla MlaB component
MLRITHHEDETKHMVRLEGKIAGAWVEELGRFWHSLAGSLGSKQVHMDLRGVAFVDGEGRQLLREIYQRAGATFVADSPLTRYYAEEAMRESPRRGEEGA